MRDLIVVVEGETEERFVMGTLKPHLPPHFIVRAIKPLTGRTTAGSRVRGGGDWAKWRDELKIALASRRDDLIVTTMFDLYGLPTNFPETTTGSSYSNTADFADALERAMAREVGDPRFVPNIVRHEFETLVLAALEELQSLLRHAELGRLKPLQASLEKTVPEDINCGSDTAPSKRLEQTGVFSKLRHGEPAVRAAGIPKLTKACPRFGKWVSKLKTL